MSSLYSSLQTAQKNLYIYGGPILLLIGTINCLFNLIIFTRKKLRKNPCSICLIAFNISCFLLLYFSFLPAILQIGFDIEPGSSNLIYCRTRYYFGFVFACLPPFYLILASIDRTLITSSNARIRQISNQSFIYKCLISLTLFWILFHIHAFFHTNIIQFGYNLFVCYFDPGLYTILTSYYTLIVNGILPPILLAIFAFLTMRNLHHSQSMNFNGTVHSEKNLQLIRMLFTEIFICILFDFIHPSVLLYKQITQYNEKTYEITIIDQFILSLSTFILHIPYSVSFYTNLIVSKTFRKEIKKVVWVENQITTVQTF